MSEKVSASSWSRFALVELLSSPKACEWHGNSLSIHRFSPSKVKFHVFFRPTGTPNLEIFFLSSPLGERVWFLLSGQLLLRHDAFRPSSWRTSLCYAVLFIASLNDTIWVQQTFVVSRSSVFSSTNTGAPLGLKIIGVNRQSEDPQRACLRVRGELIDFPAKLWPCQIVLTRKSPPIVQAFGRIQLKVVPGIVSCFVHFRASTHFQSLAEWWISSD